MNNPHRPKRILITNIVTSNTGDAAILLGTIEILKHRYGSGTQITVFDKHAEIASKYYPWAIFRQALFYRPSKSLLGRFINRCGYGHWSQKFSYTRYLLLAFLTKNRMTFLATLIASSETISDIYQYVSADLILSSGGTYLIENYDLISAIHEYRFSLALGKKLGFFTQSLGPFTTVGNVRRFGRIFNKAVVILLRDECSKNHLKEIGVNNQHTYICADAAFVLATLKTSPLNNTENPPKLAISVRSMNFFHSDNNSEYLNYTDIIHVIVKVAIEEFGAKITFLSTCQGISEYWTNDAATAEEIYSTLPENLREHVGIDHSFRQPGDIIDTYQAFDAVIATRMHAAILAFCANTPAIGIAYEFKMEELFNRMNMSDLLINIGGSTENGVSDCVRNLLNNTSTIQNTVVIETAKMYDDAWHADNMLPEIGE